MRFYLDSGEYIDTSAPIDLSIQISSEGVLAWYLKPPRFEPVRENGFLGSVAEGGVVNFRDIYFNPHGHGTHTESHGHITRDVFPVSQCFSKYFFKCLLVSVEPTLMENGDRVVLGHQLAEVLASNPCEALAVRTLPNAESKLNSNYSATNPCYFHVDCMPFLEGIQHLLVDVPSVDREEDGGELAFHHAYWNVPENPNKQRTITELIYVPNDVQDGLYVLEMQLAHFQNDAVPSRPLLYEIKKKDESFFLL